MFYSFVRPTHRERPTALPRFQVLPAGLFQVSNPKRIAFVSSHLTRMLLKRAFFPLRWLPKDAVLPIVSGPLRGAKWVIGSGRRAFWLGIYERHFQDIIAREIGRESVSYDIGANVGFYSLLAARNGSRVLSFEPLPSNIAYLREHARLNESAIQIHNLALCDSCGRASFCQAANSSMGHLGSGSLVVANATLD